MQALVADQRTVVFTCLRILSSVQLIAPLSPFHDPTVCMMSVLPKQLNVIARHPLHTISTISNKVYCPLAQTPSLCAFACWYVMRRTPLCLAQGSWAHGPNVLKNTWQISYKKHSHSSGCMSGRWRTYACEWSETPNRQLKKRNHSAVADFQSLPDDADDRDSDGDVSPPEESVSKRWKSGSITPVSEKRHVSCVHLCSLTWTGVETLVYCHYMWLKPQRPKESAADRLLLTLVHRCALAWSN